MPDPNIIDVGLFIPLVNVYDAHDISQLKVGTDAFSRFLVSLIEDMRKAATAINLKETGYYLQEEFVTGNLFYPTATGTDSSSSQAPPSPIYRPSYRFVVDFGALPNATSISVPHGLPITSDWQLVKIEAVANDQTGLVYLPLPYVAPVVADSISLRVTGTDVIIETAADYSAYTAHFIILEFIKF